MKTEKSKSSYVTKQRRIILSFLEEQRGRHYSALEISDRLKERGESIGQATVYRSLEKLESEGLACRLYSGEGQPACWMLCEKDGDAGERHYHLVCRKCGGLTHIECEYLEKLAPHILAEHGFTLDPFCNVLYGLCRSCSSDE